jgi:hypothetical protein
MPRPQVLRASVAGEALKRRVATDVSNMRFRAKK